MGKPSRVTRHKRVKFGGWGLFLFLGEPSAGAVWKLKDQWQSVQGVFRSNFRSFPHGRAQKSVLQKSRRIRQRENPSTKIPGPGRPSPPEHAWALVLSPTPGGPTRILTIRPNPKEQKLPPRPPSPKVQRFTEGRPKETTVLGEKLINDTGRNEKDTWGNPQKKTRELIFGQAITMGNHLGNKSKAVAERGELFFNPRERARFSGAGHWWWTSRRGGRSEWRTRKKTWRLGDAKKFC